MGYGPAPWEFKGRALYQLSLVRVEEAKRYLPPELPVVNFFGWTLGGFYLARYTDSPVGAFEELVALAGLAWNAPTSCAWAARVFVNDREARDHGMREVGLPSRMASFKAVPLPTLLAAGSSKQRSSRASSWWGRPEPGSSISSSSSPSDDSSNSSSSNETAVIELFNCEPTSGGWWPLLGRRGGKRRGLSSAVCRIELPKLAPAWAPGIRMSLPSFSGATPEHPGLVQYSLELSARVRPVSPARVSFPAHRPQEDQDTPELLDAVLGGRPLLCLAFDDMRMEVQAPEAWHPSTGSNSRQPLPNLAAA